jgi:Tfp pilus assembly protein PilO
MALPGEKTLSPNKMTKQKRIQLIGLILATLVVLGGLGYGLIRWQYDNLQVLARKKSEDDSKLRLMETTVRNAEQIEADLAETSQALAEKEATMASGDLYSWSINTMKRFKTGYKVEIPQFGPISQATEVNLLPSFPYKQATLNIGGKAYYHDLGSFITDFENQFPFMRGVNLALDLDPSQATGDREKLSFKMDIITLVKSGNP